MSPGEKMLSEFGQKCGGVHMFSNIYRNVFLCDS